MRSVRSELRRWVRSFLPAMIDASSKICVVNAGSQSRVPLDPATIKRHRSAVFPPHFVGEPYLGGNGLLHPLLKITGIPDQNIFPSHFGNVRFFPSILSWPSSRRDEDESHLQSLSFRNRFNAFCKVPVCLTFNVFVGPKLPSRRTGGHPRIANLGFGFLRPTQIVESHREPEKQLSEVRHTRSGQVFAAV